MSNFTQHLHDFASSSRFGRFVESARGIAHRVNTMVGSGVSRNDIDEATPALLPSSSSSSSPRTQGKTRTSAMMQEFFERSVQLGPMVKRHIFEDFPDVPDGLSLGWAQLPQLDGRFFALGMFLAPNEFCQVALVDGKGRVFLGGDPQMDTHDVEPALVFGKEGDFSLSNDSRMRGGKAGKSGSSQQTFQNAGFDAKSTNESDPVGEGESRGIDVVQGGIVGRDMFGQMTWLASWLKRGNRYTLEQMRYRLPENLRLNLEYRDAMAIAFFATYMLPQMSGQLIGFGAGNIFRRLNREAPLGAIRRSVRDSMEARTHGLRVSGLEDYFADLMRESGALKPSAGLEAVHGAEPLHLYTSSYSGAYFFTWDDSLNLAPALEALNIEGNLNRFASVSVWLEHNAHTGALPIEDTVTRAQAAQIDHALLENPALMALKPLPKQGADLREPSSVSLSRMIGIAGKTADRIAADAAGNDHASSVQTAASTSVGRGEWVYRQALSTLLRQIRVPYRFDTEFRSNLELGNVAVAFTTAGRTMMPTSRYDSQRHTWVALSENERTAMSERYNLRVGLMIAALCFGADDSIQNVSIRIDSMGLEEAVEQQDSAISKLMAQALGAFERMPSGDMRRGGSKADPKDGDIHGDPSQAGPVAAAHDSMPFASSAMQTPEDDESNDSAESQNDDGGQGHAGSNADADKTNPTSAAQASAPTQAQSSPADGVSDGKGDNSANNGNRQGGSASENPRFANTEDSNDNETNDDSRDDFHGDEAQIDAQFADLMKGVDLDSIAMSVPQGDQETEIADDAQGEDDSDGNDPLAVLRSGPTAHNMATVTFTREEFMRRIASDGLKHPIETYREFGASLNIEAAMPRNANPQFTLRDKRFSPLGSQEEPELADVSISGDARRVLGTDNITGLSIQRADLLQRAVSDFHRIAEDDTLPSVAKAQQAIAIVESNGDPELKKLSPSVSSSLIDGVDTPDLDFTLAKDLDAERVKARDLLFSGQVDQAIASLEEAVEKVDALYAPTGAPRYFNSYAERVVYNRLFATSDENTVLIPDNLFYAHMELADVLAQLQGAKAALPHLNQMVSYAPAYPLSHIRLAVQLAREEDWNSARAACLNALRVSLDRDDAAYAYYRLAYAEWMLGDFDVAAASYIMSEHISPGKIASLDGELQELLARAQSQCILVPVSFESAQQVLASHDLPVWPHTEVGDIVRDAARVCVDKALFVPARTLSVAAARMDDSADDGMDMAQAQFLRSLNA
ncbi:tetratricopeptide repeat protein [Bifidobacterium sp. ESL0769]|uniref:tetratricopeptide repeat protein n=1 Tax=Bifidobacterium sp. ESL0769 TaxID=2983229 RepID=UPI0023F71879|nr:tetratricopeptide repeat protein [Bifidobacterium sp. ESL0769]WEV66709.1 tetratricopeptide repeat protein [Bifidobacterium sp. ESL0769]